MAGDWLKIEAGTPEKEEVLAITSLMGWTDPDLTVGKLFRVWRWFDQQTVDGNAPRVTSALLDKHIGVSGFCDAMQEVGWLVDSDPGVTLPKFDRHNGATAKSRALTAKRVAKHKGNAEGNGELTPEVTATPLPREEKRREEKDQKQESNDSSASPDGEAPEGRSESIPMQAILGLYNATMTRLPKARELTPKRRTLIRSAWQASPKRRSVAFWENFFLECEDNDFLNGTGPYRNGHETWRPDFDFLLKQETVTKVFERALDRLERGEA